MKSHSGAKNCDLSEAFFGSSTIGERGQIVIPADARNEMGFQPGDKVLIMRHPVYKGLMLCKLDAVKEFLDEFSRSIEKFEVEKLGKEEEEIKEEVE